MVQKICLILGIAVCFILATYAAECPSYTKVTNCTPKCLHDSECSSVGGKCCPNLCNGRSCADPNVLDKNKGSGAFNKNDKYGSGTGSYCGNVKCSPYEKCSMNSSTKRPECKRS